MAYEVRLLDVRVHVSGPAALLDELAELFPPPPSWTVCSDATVTTALHLQDNTPRPGWYHITHDGTPVYAAAQRDQLLPALAWAITSAAIDCLSCSFLLLHAGAMAYAGNGLLLPAASGSGKTTLVAGLLAAGFHYLSDDITVLELTNGQLMPFAKSLCVKAGARETLSSLFPQLATARPRCRSGQEVVQYLRPPEDAWPAAPVPVRYVVLPQYRVDAPTTLVPVSRLAALERLLEQSFTVQQHGARGVGVLIEMLRSVACYRLTVGNLPTAVSLLRQLMAT